MFLDISWNKYKVLLGIGLEVMMVFIMLKYIDDECVEMDLFANNKSIPASPQDQVTPALFSTDFWRFLVFDLFVC